MSEGALGTHVISLRSAWRLGGALLIVTAVTSLATALLLPADTSLAIDAMTAVSILLGLICLQVPSDRADERWLLAIPIIATAQVALAVGLIDFVLTSLFLLVALYVAVVFPSPQISLPFLCLMAGALQE